MRMALVARDTSVHALADLLAVGVRAVRHLSGVLPETEAARIVTLLVFYGIVLSGSHLYLALRQEGGMVPIRSRWQYLGMLGLAFGCAVVIILAGDVELGPITVNAIALLVMGVALIGYFPTESMAGYQHSVADRRQ